MTKEESRLFFHVPEDVEAEDYYEEQLFEFKQFFLNKSPIRKVFLSKLEKLKKMEMAYCVQVDKDWPHFDQFQANREPIFSDNVLAAFQQFEREKGQFKLKLMTAFDGVSLYRAVVDYLTVCMAYRQKWLLPEGEELNYEGNVSKDPDPMYVLKEIRQFNEQGGEEFTDVLKFGSNSFLLNEMKRVSLLNKNYGG